MEREQQIRHSWSSNATKWIDVIRREKIESRRLVTNEAIVKAILKFAPRKVLDLGCGEGWLCRALNRHGVETVGLDATEGLIQSAREQGNGERYEMLAFEDIIAGQPLPGAPFDGIAINFSLFAEASTAALLQALKPGLCSGTLIFIQTLHPYFQIDKGQPYISQWHDNSWDGLEGGFTDPHHWYYRTMADWLNLFAGLGLKIVEVQEPLHPQNQRPASVIFTIGTGQ